MLSSLMVSFSGFWKPDWKLIEINTRNLLQKSWERADIDKDMFMKYEINIIFKDSIRGITDGSGGCQDWK